MPSKTSKTTKATLKHCFVLTGKFTEPKAAIHARITAAGHSFGEDMRKGETTHLVTAQPDSGSSKSKKADSWGIPVISGNELDRLLEA